MDFKLGSWPQSHKPVPENIYPSFYPLVLFLWRTPTDTYVYTKRALNILSL